MILNRQHNLRVAVEPLERFLGRLQKALKLPEEAVAICLVSDSAIARLNRIFRGKRGATDVLSFPADGNESRHGRQRRQRKKFSRIGLGGFSYASFASSLSSSSFLGDIAISPATAHRNTRRFGRSLQQELQILILHGVLHLLGYDHETDHGEMHRRERQLRRRLGIG